MGSVAVSQSKRATSYTVSFTQPLDPSSAMNRALYRVLGGVKKVVKKHTETVYTKVLNVRSVFYNPGTQAVTITLAKPYKGTVQVTIEPGLEAATGASNSNPITDVAG
jgi:hypothetical protein